MKRKIIKNPRKRRRRSRRRRRRRRRRKGDERLGQIKEKEKERKKRWPLFERRWYDFLNVFNVERNEVNCRAINYFK